MEIKDLMNKLKATIQNDSQYAWAWHCNIAMGIYDEGVSHKKANKASARIMKMFFNVDVTKFKEWEY